MKCHILFSGEIRKKNILNMSSGKNFTQNAKRKEESSTTDYQV